MPCLHLLAVVSRAGPHAAPPPGSPLPARLLLEQAIAYVAQLRQVALDAPHGSVLHACEGLALSDGRARSANPSQPPCAAPPSPAPPAAAAYRRVGPGPL